MDFERTKGQELLSDKEAALDPDIVPDFVPGRNTLSDRSVAIFTLDMRSHKTPWSPPSNFFLPVYEGEFLGDRQEKWFVEAIRRSTAAVNIVVQGVQVHADRAGSAEIAENWGRYPLARARLYQALLQENVKAPLLVSGDVHHAPNGETRLPVRSNEKG